MKGHRRPHYSNFYKIYKMKVFRLMVLYMVLSFMVLKKHLKRRRARIYWAGRYRRPPRPERMIIFLLTFGAMAVLEPVEYIYWSVLWGGSVSIFLNLHAIYRLIPRKQYHWVK